MVGAWQELTKVKIISPNIKKKKKKKKKKKRKRKKKEQSEAPSL